MSFQWIIDRAEAIGMERKRITASTTSRSGIVRTVSRGSQAWRIEVKLPDGIPWTELRPYISQAEQLDRVSTGTLQLNNAGSNYIAKYQGSGFNRTDFRATITLDSPTITLTAKPTITGTYAFRAGDFIQLGSSGKVYTVAADVVAAGTSLTMHRPCLDSSDTGVELKLGPDCIWTVYCIQFPSWSIGGRNQVYWNGSFIFAEALV